MNSCGFVLVNGTCEEANWTSFQRNGNAVVDLVWIHHTHLHEVKQLKVYQEPNLGDHALISVSISIPGEREDKTQVKEADK